MDIPAKLAAEAAGGLAAQLRDARQRLCWVNTGVLSQARPYSFVTSCRHIMCVFICGLPVSSQAYRPVCTAAHHLCWRQT